MWYSYIAEIATVDDKIFALSFSFARLLYLPLILKIHFHHNGMEF